MPYSFTDIVRNSSFHHLRVIPNPMTGDFSRNQNGSTFNQVKHLVRIMVNIEAFDFLRSLRLRIVSLRHLPTRCNQEWIIPRLRTYIGRDQSTYLCWPYKDLRRYGIRRLILQFSAYLLSAGQEIFRVIQPVSRVALLPN